jgi:chemotaxis protein histidine kinase CheA
VDVTHDRKGTEADVFDVADPFRIWASEPRGSYADVALADIAHIAGLVTAMRGAPIRAGELSAGLMRVGLNLKGQAATMGYPLLTEVATSLTDFLDALRNGGRNVADDPRTAVPVLQAHVEALCLFMALGATARGNETARAMIERLGQIVATALDRADV